MRSRGLGGHRVFLRFPPPPRLPSRDVYAELRNPACARDLTRRRPRFYARDGRVADPIRIFRYPGPDAARDENGRSRSVRSRPNEPIARVSKVARVRVSSSSSSSRRRHFAPSPRRSRIAFRPGRCRASFTRGSRTVGNIAVVVAWRRARRREVFEQSSVIRRVVQTCDWSELDTVKTLDHSTVQNRP